MHMLKKRTIIKISICIVYILVIFILGFCSFRIFVNDNKPGRMMNASVTTDYTYLDVSEMSKAFAFSKDKTKQFHFVVEKEKNGTGHTYLIAIKKKDEIKYQKIIDYTYEFTKEVPKSIRVYGYPIVVNSKIKDLAVKQIKNFLPSDNKVEITSTNYEEYLTNAYLDTTIKKVHKFNYTMLILLLMIVILIILLLTTLFDKDKIVDEVNKKIDEDNKKNKKRGSKK